jgi:hypothetical protein
MLRTGAVVQETIWQIKGDDESRSGCPNSDRAWNKWNGTLNGTVIW